jgi:hypothetical protein
MGGEPSCSWVSYNNVVQLYACMRSCNLKSEQDVSAQQSQAYARRSDCRLEVVVVKKRRNDLSGPLLRQNLCSPPRIFASETLPNVWGGNEVDDRW